MFDCCGSHHHGSHFKKAVSCPTPGTISVPFPTNLCPPCVAGFLARTAALNTDLERIVTTGSVVDIPLDAASIGNGIGFNAGTGKLVILTSGFYNLFYQFKAFSRGGNLDAASTQLTAGGIAIPGSQATAVLSLMGNPKTVEVPFAQRPPAPVFLAAGTEIGIQLFGIVTPGNSPDLLTITTAVLTIESAI